VKTIKFKSTHDNWRKEYLGLKTNTIRKFGDRTDVRLEILRDYIDEIWNLITIEIENTKTSETFKRIVTDVTKFEDYYIISWRHDFPHE